jgi:hypothetical protein
MVMFPFFNTAFLREYFAWTLNSCTITLTRIIPLFSMSCFSVSSTFPRQQKKSTLLPFYPIEETSKLYQYTYMAIYYETVDLYSISFLSIKTKMNSPSNACSQMITVGLIVDITYCIAFGVCFTWTWKHVLRSLWRRWVSHLPKRHFIWEISELLSFFYSNIK